MSNRTINPAGWGQPAYKTRQTANGSEDLWRAEGDFAAPAYKTRQVANGSPL